MKSKKVKNLKFGGYSSSKGVAYYSDNYIVGCYYDKHDNLRTIVKKKYKPILKNLRNLFPELYCEEELKNKNKLLSVIFKAILLMIFEIILQSLLLKIHFFKAFFAIVQILAINFITLSVILFRDQDKKICYYHGAEHKVRRAFDKLGFVPSCEEIKKYSRYHKSCGISLITNVLFLLNVFYFIAVKFSTIMPPLSLIFAVGMALPTINPYSVIMQFFITTKEPTDREIVIAKTAYERLIDLENGNEDILDNEEISSIRKKSFSTWFFDDDTVSFDDFYDFELLSDDEEIVESARREWTDICVQESIEEILFEGIR